MKKNASHKFLRFQNFVNISFIVLILSTALWSVGVYQLKESILENVALQKPLQKVNDALTDILHAQAYGITTNNNTLTTNPIDENKIITVNTASLIQIEKAGQLLKNDSLNYYHQQLKAVIGSFHASINTEDIARLSTVSQTFLSFQQRFVNTNDAYLELLQSRSGLLNKVGVFLGIAILLFGLMKIINDFFLYKRAEEKIKKNEAKYKSLISNAGVVMYTTDLKGNILFASAKATELTGYNTAQIIGRHFSFLVDPTHLTSLLELYGNQIRKSIKETVHEFEIITKGGGKKWVEQAAVLTYENEELIGFQCVVRDISDKKQMQLSLEESAQNLKKSQYYLQAILDNTTSLIYLKDLAGRFILVNKRFKELFGLSEEGVIGKTNHDILDAELAEFYRQLDNEVIEQKKPVEIEEIRNTTKGKLSFLSAKFPLLDQDGDVFGVSGILTDITERVNNQQKLVEAMQRAEEAKKDAEEAKNMEEQFLANMSHEIRTPMNGIQGMTDLLLDSPLNEQQKEFATIIKRSVNNLLIIINDILDFSKIKAGKLTLEHTSFNFEEIIGSVKSMFAHRIEKKGLRFIVETDAQIPQVLTGDPYRLNQILVNLIGNAIKFTETGFIKLKVNILEVSGQKVLLHFAVEDTGIGIHDEAIDNIFESFTQANSSTSRLYGGTGLGLAICKRLAEMLGGSINVESKLGQGSIFSFQIPYEINNEASVVTTHIMGEVDYNTLFTGKKCLVVEDNEVNQKLINYVLKKVGIEVRVAGNGKEAIAELADNRFDFIIMDLQMPVMNGYEATLHIRNELKLQTPIIALTATVLKGEHDKCIEIGMNDYMSKPFDFDDLYKRLSNLLGVQVIATIKEDEKQTIQSTNLFDLSLLKELDDDEYLIDIISMFLDTTPPQLAEMRAFAEAANWEKVALLAHKLKGSTGMFQANELLKLLVKIETSVKSNDITTAQELVLQVVDLYAQIELALQTELASIQNKMQG